MDELDAVIRENAERRAREREEADKTAGLADEIRARRRVQPPEDKRREEEDDELRRRLRRIGAL